MQVDNELRDKHHILQCNQHLGLHAKHTPKYLITYNHVFKMATQDDEREEKKLKLGRGIRVRSQTKEVIYNVHEYFERINKKGTTKTPVKRTSEATKLGETTV